MIDRVAVAGRRITGAPDAPLIAAALLSLFAMVEVVIRGGGDSLESSSALLVSLATTAPLALARTHVLVAAVTITVAVVLTLAADIRLTAAGVVAQLLVGYLLARGRSRRLSWPVVIPFVGYAMALPSFSAVVLLATVAAAVALGTIERERGERAVREESRQVVADSLLEHAARGERARIARELHDVVAHHISMISVQAEAARLTTPGMPADGARRLVAIGDTARSALTEMRRLLGVLREDAGTEPTLVPQPGLDQLNELIDNARESSGASTRLIVHGRVAPLDPGVQLTAYRIVQEALTNARRHAPGVAVDVELDYAEEELRLRVRDNGPGPPDDRAEAGHGLLGMRERAAMVGGTLRTGRAPAGGFLVEAALPISGVAT